ncbi:hypothetical protein GQ651_00540 [Alphaproteobacteria bacterium GH1-50]|uniref:6-phosphogluconate dehydrogenase NADP-binding domain-containing protein n=1 Tax=Kangsaoukella pontilimi TaxID=2691042 RepID=A0A7C9IFS5_9RHOB|nr:3-hydroxyacyl-CoA dehydrogenase NAD-binding domain-containing protein [Kangsaoukella pontilimi]MXQ06322.1 hypothetical protein [Kangsaoukella pontilimi]
MSRTVAILGLGRAGGEWARDMLDAGWRVRVFDPEPQPSGLSGLKPKSFERTGTISGCVAAADWVIVAVPDRLELMQKIIQRAQAEAPETAIVAVLSETHEVDAIQGCAIRPGRVIHVRRQDGGGFDLNVTQRNDDAFRRDAVLALSALSAVRTIGADYVPPIPRDFAASA